MSLHLTLENLSYLTCPKNNHHEELSLVCTDRKCIDNALICAICEESAHNGHATVPLRSFLKGINLMNDESTIRLALNLEADLAVLQESFKSRLAWAKEQFLHSIYELEVKVTAYFGQLSEKYYQSFQKKSESHIVQILNAALSAQKVDDLSTLICDLKIYNQLPLQDQLQYYKISTEKKLELIINSLNKLNFKEELKKGGSSLVVSAMPFSSHNYQWSALKAPSIIINGKVATQKASNSSAERFALIESKNGTNGEIKVQFRINKLKGWIGVGICLKEKILKAGYKFNYTVPEHGSYLISANGYSWSHSRPEYNSAYKSFIFHEGDIISVNYNALERKVSFESKLTSSKFYLSTIDCPADDCYMPCVNLCNAGDEVEIINEME